VKFYLSIAILVFANTNQAEAINLNEKQSLAFEATFHNDTIYAERETKQYGVIVLGGSGGGKPDWFAEKIAELGFSTLSPAYFDRSDASQIVPQTLELIPLEYFEPAKRWLMQHPSTRHDGVIIGLSKGAELSLLLASHDSELESTIKATVAIAPSHVVWQGNPLDFSQLLSAPSSWSLYGKALPFVPYVSNEEKIKLGFDNRHRASLTQKSFVDRARIPVEKITNPVLLLTGGNDRTWPAQKMATNICDSIQRAKKTSCKHSSYEDGDHLLSNYERQMLEGIKTFIQRVD
jgi:dienelactone hydrolase